MKEPVTDQQKKFLQAYAECKSIHQAERIAGYADGTGWSVLRRYREYFLDLVLQQLVDAAPDAVTKLVAMLGDEANAPGANTRLEAIKQVLDRAGIVKREKVEIETSQGGIFFLPQKTPES